MQAFGHKLSAPTRTWPQQLVITGKTGWGDELPPGANADVRFTGYVDDDELPALYAGAQVFRLSEFV